MKEIYINYINKDHSFDKTTMLGIFCLIIVIAGVFGFAYEFIFYYFNSGMQQFYWRGGNFLPWINIYAIGSIMIYFLSYKHRKNPLKVFEAVYDTIVDRKVNPKEGSYTNYLFEKGIDKILKKVGEEATEIIIAAKNPNPEEIKYEMADFLYHAMVLMVERGVTWEDIVQELADR